MGHVYTLEIAGVKVQYKSIDFDRSMSLYPTELEAIIKRTSSVAYFDTVVVKNNGTVEWYGYLEDKKPSWSKEGRSLTIKARCRKVIAWKKWTERFSDTRTEGFFGQVDPAKLIYFLLRCPKSDSPTASVFSKIGWGIDPSDWICTAIRSADGHHPTWVATRYSGLAWRLGNLDFDQNLVVDDWTNETAQWTKNGSPEYLDDDDGTNYIRGASLGCIEAYFTFANLNATNYKRGNVADCQLHIKGRFVDLGGSDPANTLNIHVHVYVNGTYKGYKNIMFDYAESSWTDKIVDITSWVTTIGELNNTKIAIEWQSASDPAKQTVDVTYAYMDAQGEQIDWQTEDDWFKIDLGEEHDRVTGIYFESRGPDGSTKYARNYVVETSQNGSDWTIQATKTSNTVRDIIETWSPVDNVRYIRIRLTADYDAPWDISQIYIYEADDLKYCLLNEGSGSTLGPYLGSVNLDDYFGDVGAINPLNIPFGRVNENIDAVVTRCHENYAPWEWWIDYATGNFYFAARKGSDKSGSISFVKATHLSGVTQTNSIKNCITRSRVVGKSESKKQDEISSDWKVNTTEESTLNTFYEDIESVKGVSNKNEGDVLASVKMTQNGPPEQQIEIAISNDPYDPMAYDVGDDVTITDAFTSMSGAYRIMSLHKRVTKKGEEITLFVGNRWKDVSDEFAEIRRKLQEIGASGTVIEDWLAEGGNQEKLDMNKTSGSFEVSAKNDEETPPSSKTDPNWSTITGDGSWSQELVCSEDYFLLKGSKDAGASHNLNAYIKEPSNIPFNKNPKFVCDFKILVEGSDPATGSTSWRDNDVCWIRMFNDSNRGFGFYVIKQSGAYYLKYGVNDAGGGTFVTYGVTLEENRKYRFEAEVDWDARIVKFSVDTVLAGIVRFSPSENGTGAFYPLDFFFTTSNPNPVTSWSQIYIYKYNTEWEWIGG